MPVHVCACGARRAHAGSVGREDTPGFGVLTGCRRHH